MSQQGCIARAIFMAGSKLEFGERSVHRRWSGEGKRGSPHRSSYALDICRAQKTGISPPPPTPTKCGQDSMGILTPIKTNLSRELLMNLQGKLTLSALSGWFCLA